MSLINQVLNDLEKRGANALADEPAIRAVSVPQERHSPLLPLLAGLAALAAAVAAGWWWGAHDRPAAPAPSLPRAQPQRAPPPLQAGSAVQPASAPQISVPASAVPSSAPVAAQLSFELNTIPLPSTARAKPAADADRPAHKPARRETDDRKPAVAAAPAVPASAVAQTNDAGRQLKQVSVKQQADNEFRKANGLLQQGRTPEAIAGYEAALRLNPDHDEARQALVAVLLDEKRNADAERVLQENLAQHPDRAGFAMMLARMQVERNALPQALETLQKTLPYAGDQPEYQAFIAAVQQRLGQHQDAVVHYQAALRSSPDSGVWLMGMGISLQALHRNQEARDAFKHAVESHTLNAQLQAFVLQRLKEL